MAEPGIGPYQTDVLALCFHAVSATWPSEIAIDPVKLEKQVRFLLRRGYRPATFAAALQEPSPHKRLVVTFDDAFRSVLEIGFPVLDRLGVPATVFVPTDFAASRQPMAWSRLGSWVGTSHEGELHCMSWDELRRLSGAGWEIGSHSCSHPNLVDLDETSAAEELQKSREACEEALQRPCVSLAYPFGSYDQRVKSLARRSGYRAAGALNSRALESLGGRDSLEVPREGIYRWERWPTFVAKTSPAVRRARALPFFGALSRAGS
jgi:peptidoglycan/xylan/chitin deacetylase (PgdA/CDA1 family)